MSALYCLFTLLVLDIIVFNFINFWDEALSLLLLIIRDSFKKFKQLKIIPYDAIQHNNIISP